MDILERHIAMSEVLENLCCISCIHLRGLCTKLCTSPQCSARKASFTRQISQRMREAKVLVGPKLFKRRMKAITNF